MYFLKDVNGQRTRIESTKELCEFYEKWAKKTLSRNCKFNHFDTLFLGNNFASKAVSLDNGTYRQFLGCPDTRNKEAYLKDNTYFTREVVLLTKNYFVLVDGKGRVVDVKLIKARCAQHVAKKEPKTLLASFSDRFGIDGNKADSQRKRDNNKLSYCKVALKVMKSHCNDDTKYPIRAKWGKTITVSSGWEAYKNRDDSRSWKDQSKKEKQWMR